ncbi:SulP family inorganic anion transporter [Bdellovibrionota bacterium FG-1]
MTNQKVTVIGEVFGGLASMLVAFPSAIAFGLLVYSPLGPAFAAQGAVVGILGAIAIGLIAPVLGGAPRLISAPCAPAAAVLGAPAFTLAVLLSIDTLKTCVIVDALTRSRHNSNRELIGQGVGNMASALIGGMAGAGMMGATLVNLSSGGRTRLSGILTGVFSLATFVVLGRLVAWVPLPALAGILLVVATRMVERKSFKLLRKRSTILDFTVIAAVVVAAVTLNLIAAAGVGLALAILLFLREQIRGSVVRRKTTGDKMFSKKRRLPAEVAWLEVKGVQTAIFELQGSLFFGTTDQLFSEIEPHLSHCKFVILDMHRVQSVDFTAIHMLEQIEGQISENGGSLLFADLPLSLPTGQDLGAYFDQVGLVRPKSHVRIFSDLRDALEWAEDRLLEHDGMKTLQEESPLGLGDIDLLSGLPSSGLALLEKCVQKRSLSPGDKIFSQGDTGDEMFLIRKGSVRIMLSLGHGKSFHLASFGRGDFFGDMSFLDQQPRSADAIAPGGCELFVLSRASFDRVASENPQVEGMVFLRLSRALALRLRQTDTELRALEKA